MTARATGGGKRALDLAVAEYSLWRRRLHIPDGDGVFRETVAREARCGGSVTARGGGEAREDGEVGGGGGRCEKAPERAAL